MKSVSRWWLLISGGILLCPYSFAQLSASPAKKSLEQADLADAAYKTYINYNRAFQAGIERTPQKQEETEIPSKYWEEQIKAQRPIKVYLHKANIVIVQRSQNNVEEGKYIYLPVSSYLPQSGDDGFEFEPNPLQGTVYQLHKVLDYKRARSK